MLWLKIFLLGCAILKTSNGDGYESAADNIDATLLAKQQSIERGLGVDTISNFKTSHRNPTHSNFHFVQNPDTLVEPELGDLLQLQTMNLLTTKERPELNPVLSALINEDVMKSIEAKRAIEEKELALTVNVDKSIKDDKFFSALHETLTTTAPTRSALVDADINVGFIDQSISFDTAGSENNKKSRIQIKKGPNGMDYEYEYVYYYDDDEDDKLSVSDKKDSERGKSRYTNIDRSTFAPLENTLTNGKAKGRSSSVDEVEDGRLPTNTRFPSRSKSINEVLPTPSLENFSNSAASSGEKGQKKISVKHPSLELVDSETFNTDEKQVKGTRNGDTELTIQEISAKNKSFPAAELPFTKQENGVESVKENSAVLDSIAEKLVEGEPTTPLMEKAAFDLYAILANENLNVEIATDADNDVSTITPDTTDADMLTTILFKDEKVGSPNLPSISTTTTTTSTSKTTTVATTTTTTSTPMFGGRRKTLNVAGRNRFKLKPGDAAGTTSTTTTISPTSEEPASKGGRNRFQRPSFGNRNRSPSSTAVPSPQEENFAKEEVKPISSSVGRGRTRNRFNIRSTTEKILGNNEDGHYDDRTVSSTTLRSLRARPTLNLRGRTRTTALATKVPTPEHSTNNEESVDAISDEKTVSSSARPRYHLNRAAGNRLLPRTRLSNARLPTKSSEIAHVEDSTADVSHHNDLKEPNDDASNENSNEANTESTVASAHGAGGFNKLKNRPRLNVQHKTEPNKPKISTPQIVRKVNPLLARRKLTLGSSTTERAITADEASTDVSADGSVLNEDYKKNESREDLESAKDEITEQVDSTTKHPARGLGLLGQRRRLPLRKPGTLL